MTDQLSNKQLTVETAAVIICTYKRPDDLARCLAALTKQTRQPDEVIIVVRETDALTLNFVNARGTHRLPLRVATVAEPGLVAARVSGLSICSTDLVSFIDDDTIPYPDWLQRVFEHFRHDPQLGGLCGRDRCGDGIRFDDRTKEEVGKLRWHGRLDGYHHLGYGVAREVDHLKGANMSYRISAIPEMPAYLRLRGKGAQPFEDTAFCLAVRRAGWKLVYDPQVLVDHLEGAREEIRYYSHTLPVTDVEGFENLSFNNVVALWDELPPTRMIAFAMWSFLVGVRVCPGVIQAIRFTTQMGLAASWHRFFVAQRGFAKAYLTMHRKPLREDLRCEQRPQAAASLGSNLTGKGSGSGVS